MIGFVPFRLGADEGAGGQHVCGDVLVKSDVGPFPRVAAQHPAPAVKGVFVGAHQILPGDFAGVLHFLQAHFLADIDLAVDAQLRFPALANQRGQLYGERGAGARPGVDGEHPPAVEARAVGVAGFGHQLARPVRVKGIRRQVALKAQPGGAADAMHPVNLERLRPAVQRLDFRLVDGVVQRLPHPQVVAHYGQAIVVRFPVAAVGVNPDMHRFRRIDDAPAAALYLVDHGIVRFNDVHFAGLQRRHAGGEFRHNPQGKLPEGIGAFLPQEVILKPFVEDFLLIAMVDHPERPRQAGIGVGLKGFRLLADVHRRAVFYGLPQREAFPVVLRQHRSDGSIVHFRNGGAEKRQRFPEGVLESVGAGHFPVGNLPRNADGGHAGGFLRDGPVGHKGHIVHIQLLAVVEPDAGADGELPRQAVVHDFPLAGDAGAFVQHQAAVGKIAADEPNLRHPLPQVVFALGVLGVEQFVALGGHHHGELFNLRLRGRHDLGGRRSGGGGRNRRSDAAAGGRRGVRRRGGAGIAGRGRRPAAGNAGQQQDSRRQRQQGHRQ